MTNNKAIKVDDRAMYRVHTLDGMYYIAEHEGWWYICHWTARIHNPIQESDLVSHQHYENWADALKDV